MQARGKAMGAEFRGKGVNVALGPMTNMGAFAFSCLLCFSP
jgi:beta-glucosidase